MEVRPLRQSSVPAGYKQTEVGVVLDDRETEPLKGKISISHGFPFASEYFASHGSYRLTTPGHFYEEGGFRDIGEKQKYYDGPVPSDYVLRPGDLIVAMTEQADGLLGSAAFIPEVEGYLHNQRLGRIKALTSEVELGFLFYVFNSPYYRAKVRETAAGTKVKHTSPEKLLEISVRLPSPPEQRAIAGALSDVDALIGALDQLIAKKRDLKQAAMQQLLTGQKRLPGFHGEWEVKRLGDVCRITTGKKDVNEGNPSGQYPFFTCARTNTFSDSYSFEGEAILIAGNGEVGNLSYCNGKFEAYQRTYVLQNFTANVSYLWQQLSAYLASSLGIGKIGSSIPYIKMGNLVGFEFRSPIDAEQTAIVEVLSDMDAELAALEQRRDKTRALKQGMMQELLTGRTRLPFDEGTPCVA